VQHPEESKLVAPAELCPILKRLYRILIKRFVLCIITTLHITAEFTVCLRSGCCSAAEVKSDLFSLMHFNCFRFTLLIYIPDLCAGSSQQGTFSKR